MKLIAYTIGGSHPEIRPAPATRDWMSATPEGFAYRCLPLNIANAHGWEILCPSPIRAWWDGGTAPESVRVEAEGDGAAPAVGHFGSGILTFHVPLLLRTEPGCNLWVSGPTNAPKDGIAPLTGVVETDWSPYGFTMNWRFTRPNHLVEFAAGEPFCLFFPLARDAVEAVEPEIRPLSDDPALEARYWAFHQGRTDFLADLPVPGTDANEAKWQKGYYRGLDTDGIPAPQHQTKLRLKPFKEG
jgi:hypothetical protein